MNQFFGNAWVFLLLRSKLFFLEFSVIFNKLHKAYNVGLKVRKGIFVPGSWEVPGHA